MKKTIITAAILAAFATPALADEGYSRDRISNIDATVNADVRTGSAAQAQNAGNAQTVTQPISTSTTVNMPAAPEQRAETTLRTINDSTSNNTQRVINEGLTTTNQNVRYSGNQTIRNVPGVVVSGPASGPCNGLSGGIGVAVPGMGVGANFSRVDEGCEERETARIAALMGRMDIANTIIENTEVYQRALERKAKADEKKAKEAAAVQAALAPVAKTEEAVTVKPVSFDEITPTAAE